LTFVLQVDDYDEMVNMAKKATLASNKVAGSKYKVAPATANEPISSGKRNPDLKLIHANHNTTEAKH